MSTTAPAHAHRPVSPDVDDLLKRTRTDRGMPIVIDDQAVIAKVAAILATASGDAG